jgi:phosphatidylglycerol:prolipoprotein diacylglycerol transferase
VAHELVGVPLNIPIHPTQIYEAIFLGCLAWALIRWRRQGVSDRTVLGRYFLIAGAFRFLLEFVRVNVRVLGPFTVAHLFSLAVAALGIVLLRRKD